MIIISLFYLNESSNSADFKRNLHVLQSLRHYVDTVFFFSRKPVHIKNEFLSIKNVCYTDLGHSLNETVGKVHSDFILFMNNQDTLLTKGVEVLLNLLQKEKILTASVRQKNINTTWPLLIQTQVLQEKKFPLTSHLPWNEALLPSWLVNIDSWHDTSDKIIRRKLPPLTSSQKFKNEIIHKYTEKVEVATDHFPTVTIVLANYNMGQYIGTAIQSCILQTVHPERILVMDDGSNDDSRERLQHWNNEGEISIFYKENGGKAKALNELIPNVETDYILELDADDWLDADAIYQVKTYLVSIPDDVAVLYGNLRNWRQTHHSLSYKNIKRGKQISGKSQILSYPLPLGPRIYKTELLKSSGGFPILSFQDGRMYEDVSVLYKLLGKYRGLYKDFTIYNVREHPESITRKQKNKWDEYQRELKNFL